MGEAVSSSMGAEGTGVLVGLRLTPLKGFLLASTREKVTWPLKPFWGAKVRLRVPCCPCGMGRLWGRGKG